MLCKWISARHPFEPAKHFFYCWMTTPHRQFSSRQFIIKTTLHYKHGYIYTCIFLYSIFIYFYIQCFYISIFNRLICQCGIQVLKINVLRFLDHQSAINGTSRDCADTGLFVPFTVLKMIATRFKRHLHQTRTNKFG
jgi:hypothetical protein